MNTATRRALDGFPKWMIPNTGIVGFERVLDTLSELSALPAKPPSWPPYNLSKLPTGEYLLEFALAGFGPDDLMVSQDGNTLTVQSKERDDEDTGQFLHRGIAKRAFSASFTLAPDVLVDAIKMSAGILSIRLTQPEEKRTEKVFTIEVE